MKVEDKKIYDFGDALYKGECDVCKESLDWEADFDADGTNYYTSCCGNHYAMFPNTVRLEIEPEENNE